jgi:hypothetical protein
MARILIDLTDAQLQALAAKVRTENRSRAAIVRDALDDYLARHAVNDAPDVFGLWKDRAVDGLDYQEAHRAEW